MKYASRKFIVAMFILIASTSLCAWGKMDDGKVMLCYSICGVGYGLYNVLDTKRDS